MKRIMIAAAIVAACVGCTSSTSVEWGGKQAVRNADGTVIVSASGEPYYETKPNRYEDRNCLTRREERGLKVKANADGSYSAELDSRTNDVSTNGIAMVTGGIDSLTRLVSTCAAAYVTIAGGGAQADTATEVVSKLVSYFVKAGGDAGKASVTTDGGKVKVTDGTTCVTCDADGVCAPCGD